MEGPFVVLVVAVPAGTPLAGVGRIRSRPARRMKATRAGKNRNDIKRFN
ncbi:MAG TPA: hypothetical protein VGR00_15135 [Thermoanaerobaculia bacterium]|nr:hypothetical protein [Thermoanaerobaculia bacterium]